MSPVASTCDKRCDKHWAIRNEKYLNLFIPMLAYWVHCNCTRLLWASIIPLTGIISKFYLEHAPTRLQKKNSRISPAFQLQQRWGVVEGFSNPEEFRQHFNFNKDEASLRAFPIQKNFASISTSTKMRRRWGVFQSRRISPAFQLQQRWGVVEGFSNLEEFRQHFNFNKDEASLRAYPIQSPPVDPLTRLHNRSPEGPDPPQSMSRNFLELAGCWSIRKKSVVHDGCTKKCDWQGYFPHFNPPSSYHSVSEWCM